MKRKLTKLKETKLTITLSGMADLMEDKFISREGEQNYPPEQKLYLDKKNGLVWPAENIFSFFFRTTHPLGCAKKFEKKQAMDFCSIGMGHVSVSPSLIPITRNGKQIIFNGFENDYDEKAHIRVTNMKGIIRKGTQPVPQIAIRPVIELPWDISFGINIVDNGLIDDTKIYNWLIEGGLKIGLGSFKPLFGRFTVTQFDVA